MSKIAILFSGYVGQFDYEFEPSQTINKCWFEIIKKYNIDIFAFTETNNFYFNDVQYFNNKESKIIVTNGNKERIHTKTKFCDDDFAIKTINNIFSFYGDNLKKIKIENYDSNYKSKFIENNINQKIFLNYKEGSESNKFGLISQFYKLFKCYELLCDYEKENNFTYDIIIRCRFDVFIDGLKNVDINSLELNNILYTSTAGFHINDYWAIGNREIMHNYCNYYLNMSPNLIENKLFFLLYNESGHILSLHTEKISNLMYDISYSSEIGLQLIIKELNYEINTTLISYIIHKFYQ